MPFLPIATFTIRRSAEIRDAHGVRKVWAVNESIDLYPRQGAHLVSQGFVNAPPGFKKPGSGCGCGR